MYDNDDDFGIDSYREDFKHVFEINKITVKRYKRTTGKDTSATGDFLGLSTTTDSSIYTGEIDVNINSRNMRQRDLEDSGENIAGVRILEGYIPHDTELNSGDIIIFKKTLLAMGIKTDERYVVKMKDIGPLKGQFCYKNFEATSLGDVDGISDTI